jgi:hypothetical protein
MKEKLAKKKRLNQLFLLLLILVPTLIVWVAAKTDWLLNFNPTNYCGLISSFTLEPRTFTEFLVTMPWIFFGYVSFKTVVNWTDLLWLEPPKRKSEEITKKIVSLLLPTVTLGICLLGASTAILLIRYYKYR